MATAFKQTADNAISTTLTNLSTTGVTSITLHSGDGAKFPQPGNGFIVTLWNGLSFPSNPALDPNMEKVLVSARSGDVFTISATTKIHTGQVTVALLDVAQNTTDLQTAVNNLETGGGSYPYEYTANKGAANGYAPLNSSAAVPVANLPAASTSSYGVIELAGDLAGTAASPAIANNAVTNAKQAQLPANTIKGNNTASPANAADLTASQVKTVLAITESDVANLTTDLAAKANDSAVVHTTGNENVAGVKTFSSSPSVPAPSGSSDAANKAYVDAIAQGLSVKNSVAALSTSNVTLSGTQTIDGVSLTVGNRVLLTGQTTASQNGIWVVQSSSWTRPTDFASGSSQLGAFTFVDGGTTYGSSGWVLVGATPITVDTTSQTWTQFSSAGATLAGTGLSKSGNTISLNTPVSVANGGTGQATQQASMDALAGAQSSGKYLRSDGTHTTLSSIQAGDVPNITESQVTNLTSDLAARVQLGGDINGGTASAPQVTGLHLAGDTAINHKLTNVTDPTSVQDAATKNYVDTHSSAGAIIGPASATDNAVVRFNGTTGKLAQNSNASLDDNANLTLSDPSGTVSGHAGFTTSHSNGTGTSTYTIDQDDSDLLEVRRTGDTTGDGNAWSIIDLISPVASSSATDDSEATLSLTTRSGAPGSVSRTLDLYNDEYSRDNGLGFRQWYKNVSPNPLRFELQDKTVGSGRWTMSGVSVTSGSPNGSYTSSSGATPAAEDWIWDNAITYFADDTKILSIDTTAKTFVLNRNAIATGTGVSARGINVREIMRLTGSRQLLVRKFIASSSSNVAEFGGAVQVDGTLQAPLQDKGGQVYNVKAYGAKGDGTTDDTTAVQSAISAMPSTAAVLDFPPGTFNIDSAALTSIPNGSVVQGAGRGATILRSTTGTNDLFHFEDGKKFITFRDMEIRVWSGGGHVFAPQGVLQQCYFLNLYIAQLNPGKSIWKQLDFGYYYNSWRECYLYHGGATTVPAFDFTSATGAVHNANSWTRLTLETESTHATYFFDFATSASADFLYTNYFTDITAEVTNGGVARVRSGVMFVFRNIDIFDLTTTVNSLFYVGAGAGNITSRAITFENITRAGGTLGTNLYDIELQSGKATSIKFINCNKTVLSGYAVQLNNNTNISIFGCPGVTFSNIDSTVAQLEAHASRHSAGGPDALTGYVDTSTTQSSIAGTKTFTAAALNVNSGTNSFFNASRAGTSNSAGLQLANAGTVQWTVGLRNDTTENFVFRDNVNGRSPLTILQSSGLVQAGQGFDSNSNTIVNVATPVNSTDAANKSYVDNVAQGLSPKPSVQAATTGSETFTISSGSVTQISGTTVDGVSPSVNDRILVKDAPAATGAGSANSTQPGNGIYVVTSNTTNLSLSRATDMDDSNDPPAGAYTFVEAGTANASAGYVVTTPSSNAAFTYGTNNIAWAQFTGAGEITAGSGLSKSGNTLSVATGGVTNAMLAGSIAASKLVGTDIATVGTVTAGTWNANKVGLAYGGTNADLSGTGGTSQVLKQTSSGAAITVGQLAASDLSNGVQGSGAVVLASSPTLTTPTIGAATATSINKVAITSPSSSATLTIADGKTLTTNNNITLAGTDGKTLTLTNSLTVSGNDGTVSFGAASKTLSVNKSLTLDGTDSTTMTFPSTSATIARTDAAQTFTGTQTYALQVQTPQTISVSGNAGTADISHGIQNFTNSSAAAMTITLTTASAADAQTKIIRIYDASAVAQSITWVNTENSNVTAPTISNGSTTLPLTVGFMFNSATSLWRCIAVA